MATSTHLGSARDPHKILEGQICDINQQAETQIQKLKEAFDFCESPLEKVFFLEYVALYDTQYGWTPDERPVFVHEVKASAARGRERDYNVFLIPQAAIKIIDKTYRADFLIQIEAWVDRSTRVFGKIVVEIDGHNFHERTKEQAAHDRSRDRALMAAGYKVVRFTGSEIYKDPIGSLYELSTFIDEACA